jgi:hypothetical protein
VSGRDKAEDILAIHRVGGTGILIRTEREVRVEPGPEYTASDLRDAVEWILENRTPCM